MEKARPGRKTDAWKTHIKKIETKALQHPLRYLFLEVSRRCNLACRYCGSDCTPRRYKNELTSAEWIGVVRQIAEDFDPKKIMIAVTGGEPLLKAGIFGLFDELHALGFPFGMVTNGTLLDKKTAGKLAACGIGSISVSMDALPPVNDSLRGEGVSAKAVAAIQHLQAAGFSGKLEIMSTISKPALPKLDDMRRYVASLHVPLWRIVPVMPIGRAAKSPELQIGPEDLRYLMEYVRTARRDDYRPKPEFCEEGFVGLEFEGEIRPYLCECRAGITVGGIKHDGMIGACPEISPAFDQGDIRQERFKVVWESRYQVMRDRSWTKKGVCGGCREFKKCRGGALHLYANTRAEALRCFHLMNEEAVCARRERAAGVRAIHS